MVNSEESKIQEIEKLTEEQLEKISIQLGEKLREIIERASQEANELLGQYGLQTTIVLQEPSFKHPMKEE